MRTTLRLPLAVLVLAAAFTLTAQTASDGPEFTPDG